MTIEQTNKGGISVGTAVADNTNTASISGVSFGTKPAIDDFSNFLVTIDGVTMNPDTQSCQRVLG